MYEETIFQGITQALNDELTSVVLYNKISQYLDGVNNEEIREEMTQHADEEMTHFKQILDFAYNHGMSPRVCFDEEVANDCPTDFYEVTSLIQSLENKAITLYTDLAKVAQDEGDLETYSFFKELMEAEMGHFDDIAKLTGEKRPLNKVTNYGRLSFVDFVKQMQPSIDNDEDEEEIVVEPS